MVTAKYVPDVPREKIIEAMELFDKELRDSPEWKGWEDKRNHKYAIKYEDRLYPEKEIIILATGAPRNSFAGGPEAISYLEDRGFTVVRIKRPKENYIFEFSEDDFSEKVDGTTWRGQLSKILRQDLSEITGEAMGGGAVYGMHQLLFFDKRYEKKYVHPKFCFTLDVAERRCEFGLYIEKGYADSEDPDEVMDNSWSWHDLMRNLEDSSYIGRLRDALIHNNLIVSISLWSPDEKLVFEPVGDELQMTNLDTGSSKLYSWQQFIDFLSSLPTSQWCEFYIRGETEIGDDRRISVEPVLDTFKAVVHSYYSVLTDGSQAEVLYLLGAIKDRDEVVPLETFFSKHGRFASWWSYPVRNEYQDLIRENLPLSFLLYQGGALFVKWTIADFVTSHSSDGIVSPWPDYTLEEERDRTKMGERKSEICKTWFLVEGMKRLDPPESLNDYVHYESGETFVPQSLISSFGYVKQRELEHGGAGELNDIYSYFADRGFHFPDEVITDYCISLKTKPFVILSGISGTGKTKIAQVFADYMCPKEDVEVSEVPENGDSEFYIHVGKQVLNQSQLNIPVLLAEYFDIPEKGSAKTITFEFGSQQVRARLMNIGFTDPKYPRMLLIYLRKRVTQWIRENFSLGDYMKITVLDEDLTRYRLEKFEPEKRVMATSRAVFIPVRPDWMDNRGLLGFYNILTGEYQPTELLKLMLRAAEDPDRPYFVILDEMNLAKVEYYFADFLSCIESRLIGEDGGMTQEAIRLHDQEEDLEFVDEEGVTYYISPALQIPRNLYFTGTVNVDETTYMFSPKVLDRANTIEFNEVDLVSYGKGEGFSTGSDFVLIDGTDIRESFEDLKLATADDYRNLDEEVQVYLETIHNILRPYYLHFGYRVANEIALYINNSIELTGDDNKLIALDLQIMQKVLPKFHGAREKLEEPLLKLLLLCCGKEEGEDEVQYSQVIKEYEEMAGHVLFPRAASKIARMLRALHEQGFVSFVE